MRTILAIIEVDDDGEFVSFVKKYDRRANGQDLDTTPEDFEQKQTAKNNALNIFLNIGMLGNEVAKDAELIKDGEISTTNMLEVAKMFILANVDKVESVIDNEYDKYLETAKPGLFELGKLYLAKSAVKTLLNVGETLFKNSFGTQYDKQSLDRIMTNIRTQLPEYIKSYGRTQGYFQKMIESSHELSDNQILKGIIKPKETLTLSETNE